jgi:pimeloyl-ACP methyl ester carboxylesterase
MAALDHPELFAGIALLSPGGLVQVPTATQAVLRAYYGVDAIMNRPDRTGILKNFDGPVLFIAGVLDQAVSIGQTLSECRYPRISQITILEKSAHTGMLEEPERAAAALLNFLQLAED